MVINRRFDRQETLLKACTWGMVLMLTMPLLVVLSAFFTHEVELWDHFPISRIGEIFFNTALVVGCTGLAAGFLGVSLAFAVTAIDFPGRRFLSWALILPLASPGYVTGFVYLSLMEYSGPLQTLSREWLGTSEFFPMFRSGLGAVFVLSLGLFPYVFLICRAGFRDQGMRMLEVARTLGKTPLGYFFSIGVPMAAPWLWGGMSLVMMECLADFGTVAVFNFDTFTTAVYMAWYGFFSHASALQMASLLVSVVFILTLVGQMVRNKRRYAISGQTATLLKISPWARGLMALYAWGVFVLAFLLPMGQLLIWVVAEWTPQTWQSMSLLILNSSLVGGMVALLAVMASALLVVFRRVDQTPSAQIIFQAANLGYAIPGSVLAIGVYVYFFSIDQALEGLTHRPLLTGSLAALVFGGTIRYLAVASHSLGAAIEKVTPSLEDSARLLGSQLVERVRRLYVPLMRRGVVVALILVFTDMMKEMPLTLMTRPFGWDTLAVKVYELTSEGEWQLAAIPALFIVATGFIPIVILTRNA